MSVRGATTLGALLLFTGVSSDTLRAAEHAEDTSPLQYEITDAATGRRLYTVWGWSEPVDGEPDHVAAISDVVFQEGGEWKIRSIFTRDIPPRCVSWEGTRIDKNGEVLARNQTRWVPEVFPLVKTPFPPDTYPVEAPLGYVLTRLGLGAQQEKASFHFVLMDTFPRVDLWIDGKETLRVPAGTFECYRVRMRADAASLFPKLPAFLRPFLSFFIPTYTLWMTSGEPQMIVQYAGQIGPPGSPELRMRLLAIGNQP